jgi:putative membrane protein
MSWIISLLVFCSIFALMGSLLGGMTGLVPGLHPNAVAVMLAGFPQLFAVFTIGDGSGSLEPAISSSMFLGCFLIGVLMGHSMTEIIPTAMLGVSDDETVVAQLPSQRLYGLGRSDLVIEAAVVGGLGAVALFALLFVPTRLLMGQPIGLYSAIRPFMGFLLIGISAFVLLSSRHQKRFLLSVASFILSGMIGIVVLTLQLPTQMTMSAFSGAWPVDSSSFLLPAFSGFFAVPALIFHSGNRAPPDSGFTSGERIQAPVGKPLLRSLLPSILVGWIPGITNAYALSFVSPRRRDNRHSIGSAYQYLITYTATNVGGSLQSIIALATIFRARNGTLEAINDNFTNSVLGWFQGLEPPIAIIAFIWAACIATVVGTWSCMLLGRRAMRVSSPGKSFKLIRATILSFILLLVFLASGPVGLLVMVSCATLGAWSIFKGVPRVHLMGFLIVPVIVYFLLN